MPISSSFLPSTITDHRSSIPMQRLAVIQCRAGRVRRQWGCHLYFARRVTFVSCADISGRKREENRPAYWHLDFTGRLMQFECRPVDRSTGEHPMPYRKVTEKSLRLTKEDSTIIGFRLPNSIAQAVKVEAAKRQLALNSLFVEMWQLYTNEKSKK
jgi:hypothetical protein